MQDWHQAFWLTKYELKHSKLNYLIFTVIAIIIFLFLVIPVVPDYFSGKGRSFNLDILFLVIFATISQLARAKVFQNQKVRNYFWASHFIIVLNQLPIAKEVIIKYRFLSYFIISIFISVLFLAPLYIFSPVLQSLMSIESFLVFSFTWLCFTVGIGSSQIVSDAGTNPILNFAVTLFIIAPLALIFMVMLFNKVYPHGFVHWTMFISVNYPLWTVVGSLLLVFIGPGFWMKRMDQKMSRTDYL